MAIVERRVTIEGEIDTLQHAQTVRSQLSQWLQGTGWEFELIGAPQWNVLPDGWVAFELGIAIADAGFEETEVNATDPETGQPVVFSYPVERRAVRVKQVVQWLRDQRDSGATWVGWFRYLKISLEAVSNTGSPPEKKQITFGTPSQ